MTESPASPRVLLVEFVTTDRFHCAFWFPHVKGLLGARGVPVRWLRFAMRAAVQLARDEEGIGLEAADRETLTRALSAHGATHVLFSHHPAASLRSALPVGQAAPQAAVFGSVAGLATVTDHGEAPLPAFESMERLGVWLGLSDPVDIDALAPPVDLAFDPDYRFEAANRAAAEMQPFVFVLAGAECSYLRSLAENPAYAELVAAGAVPERFGCTFCRRPVPDGAVRHGLPPREWALRQLRAIAATHPPSPSGRLALRLVGERVVGAIDALAGEVAALPLPPSELLVDARADTLVRLAPRLEAAARTLGAAGHRLEVCLIGVENFSHNELVRFNKGLEPEDNLAALRALRRIEAAVPDAFGFRAYGGLSTVLYTPWTTLEDVALNLAVVRHFRLQRICGKVLTSRARLYPELPLAALARRDGLLVASYDDPLLDTARRNFYESELPWRFRDARVERFNRLATRLQTDPALTGEGLYEDVQRARAESGADELAFAERLCGVIEQHPDLDDLSALLALVGAGHTPEPGPRPEPVGVTASARRAEAPGDGPGDAPSGASPGPPPGGIDDPILASSVDWAGFVAGVKPVCRLEPLSAEELARVEPRIRAAHPEAVLQARRRDWTGVESYELFVGRSAAEVDELVAILGARDRGVAGDEGRDHVRRTGALLGYPACCTERFVTTPEVGWLHNEWLHVRNRIETPGPVPVALRPLNGPLSYVLCSADCAVSRANLEALRTRAGVDPAPPMAEWPILFLLERPAHFAVLRPLEPVSERFRYALAGRFGDEPRLARLAEGDTIEIDPGQIRILGGGRVLASFSLDAYVWWHERAFHPAFWRLAVEQKLTPVLGPGDVDDTAPVDPGMDEQVPEVRPEVAEQEEASNVPRLDALLALVRRLVEGAGLPCTAVVPTTDGDIDLTLQHASGPIELRWLNRDAPEGVVAVLGAPLVGRGRTGVAAVRKLAPLLQNVLEPAWKRGLRDRLDRGNREHHEVSPVQGVRFLVRKRLAAGRPLWGRYVLERFDEVLGDDGRPSATLSARAGDTVVTMRFGPASPDAPAPFHRGPLGELCVVDDTRTPAQRATLGHQVERCVGFHFARAVPVGAVWGPVPPPEEES